jgi:hypothetical protein
MGRFIVTSDPNNWIICDTRHNNDFVYKNPNHSQVEMMLEVFSILSKNPDFNSINPEVLNQIYHLSMVEPRSVSRVLFDRDDYEAEIVVRELISKYAEKLALKKLLSPIGNKAVDKLDRELLEIKRNFPKWVSIVDRS